jgi:hypothetical protein
VNLAMVEDGCLANQLRELEVYYTSEYIPGKPVERTGEPEHTSYTTYIVTGL